MRKVNKRKKSVKISPDDCDLVGVHIRRTDHLEFEKLNGATPLTRTYFTQAGVNILQEKNYFMHRKIYFEPIYRLYHDF